MVQERLNEYSKSAITKAHRRRYGLFIFLIFAGLIMLLYSLFIQNSENQSDSKMVKTPHTKSCASSISEKELLSRITSSANYTDKLTRFKCVMSIKYQGRLGNLMGEYATLYALAKSNNRLPFLLPEMHNLLNIYFDLSIPKLNPTIANIPWIDYVIHDWMSPEYNNISGAFVKLRGYPCSWTFYHHLRDEISREFTFKHEIITDAQNHLQRITEERKTSNLTFVGVHVRRGDYIDVIKKYHGVLADTGYLKQAFAYYRNKYSNVVFVVCSDGLDWCENNIDNSLGDVYFCFNGSASTPGKDMALLIQCNHSVISIGTFGYWVAYLTGGDVVYLTNFTASDSFFHEVFHYKDAYLPEWIGIPANMTGVDFTNNVTRSIFIASSSIFIFLTLLMIFLIFFNFKAKIIHASASFCGKLSKRGNAHFAPADNSLQQSLLSGY